MLDRIRAALAAGVDYVQIREKSLSTRDLFRLVEGAVAVRRSGRLLVNDRADVALACGADGVHLPAERPPATEIRALAAQSKARLALDDAGPGFLVGVSCHSVEEVERAAAEAADFAVLGPIFTTPGKGSPLGLEPLELAARLPIPVLALGGLTLENAGRCLEAGAAGVAGIRLFQNAADLADVVRKLKAL